MLQFAFEVFVNKVAEASQIFKALLMPFMFSETAARQGSDFIFKL